MLSDKMGFLERAFAVLNHVYFEDSLPDEVVITLQSSIKSYAHFTINKAWKKGDDKGLHEINISVEHLNRGIENILASLQHELIHYYCHVNKISEVSNNGRYHNKRFKVEAEKRGLKIEYAKSIGWSVTKPTESFIEILRTNGLLDMQMDEYRISGSYGNSNGNDGDSNGGEGGVGKKGKTKPSSTRNYECGCGNKLRVTKDMTDKILCLECGSVYIEKNRGDREK